MTSTAGDWRALQQTCVVAVDARGLNCPLPLLKTKRAIAPLASGARVSLMATDPGSMRDLSAWAQEAGHAMLCAEHDDDGFRFVFEKDGASAQ